MPNSRQPRRYLGEIEDLFSTAGLLGVAHPLTCGELAACATVARSVHAPLAATSRFAMLRITIDESPGSVTLRLEGKLIGLWVEEVEQCWRKVFETLGPSMVLVDLSAVDFVDRAGRLLLARMQSAGFRIEASGPLMENLLEQNSQDSRRLN